MYFDDEDVFVVFADSSHVTPIDAGDSCGCVFVVVVAFVCCASKYKVLVLVCICNLSVQPV